MCEKAENSGSNIVSKTESKENNYEREVRECLKRPMVNPEQFLFGVLKYVFRYYFCNMYLWIKYIYIRALIWEDGRDGMV